MRVENINTRQEDAHNKKNGQSAIVRSRLSEGATFPGAGARPPPPAMTIRPMRNDEVITIRRQDYQPPPYLLDSADLEFDLDLTRTLVTSTLKIHRREAGAGGNGNRHDVPLILDGEDLGLLGVDVN